MENKRYWIILWLVFFLPFAGSRQPPQPGIRYVTQAQIQLTLPEGQKLLEYRDPAKITSVLTCLRLAAPYGHVQKADVRPTGHSYRISLVYSDMTRQTYYMQDYRYFTRDGIYWQKVRPDKAQLFYLLVQLLPGDS